MHVRGWMGWLVGGCVLKGVVAMGSEATYARTAVGTCEIKTLPARVGLAAEAPGDAFDARGAAFRQLFAYIQEKQISMTVPVEAAVETNRMLFFAGAADQEKATPGGAVRVVALPPLTVASLGMRGGYTRSNYEDGMKRLSDWLAIRPEWRTNGAPYMVYWNSPFVPWFLKRSEIHQPVEASTARVESPFYAIEMRSLAGEPVKLDAWRGRVVLLVNVASRCGFTRQYAGLEALHRQYAGRGFAVLGFPSNDFMGQEPGTAEEIASFCRLTYDVTFPMFEKIAVKGEAIHPLYRWLTDPDVQGEHGGPIGWNFTKFVIGRDGRVRARFGSRTTPDDPALVKAVEDALAAGG